MFTVAKHNQNGFFRKLHRYLIQLPMLNDRELFLQIKQGNKKSFEELFMAYYAPLCAFARKYIKDADECEEIVQGFFTRLWDKRDDLEINLSVKNYLFSSVRNRCINYLKHSKIKVEYQNDFLKSTDTQSDFSDAMLEIDLVEKIEKSIAELPQRRREIFVLSREKGLKYREIADELGISIKTVEAQMGQALKDLRDSLKEYRQLLISFLFVLPLRVSKR
jgi:RNA polymerase sigma-70 factor (ECF subfamily)